MVPPLADHNDIKPTKAPQGPRHRYRSGLMEHFIAGFQSHVFLVDILIGAVATLYRLKRPAMLAGI